MNTNANMGRGHEWREAMAGLLGRRLEVYDDLLQGKQLVDDLPPEIENALGWLRYHRLVYPVSWGWAARAVGQAHELFMAEGPARDAGGIANLPERGADGVAEPSAATSEDGKEKPDNGPARPDTFSARPCVHNHQPELFADERT